MTLAPGVISVSQPDTGDITVFKVGGSLLDWPEFPERLMPLLAEVQKPLLIIGGGEAADVVRTWSRLHPLSESTAHWLAIHSLTLSARLATELLPNTVVVSSRETAADAWCRRQIPVLCLADFVIAEESRPARIISQKYEAVPQRSHHSEALPHTWDVTSDSLAAWVTLRWPARDLCLIKSAPLPHAALLTDASRLGLVDPYFPGLAGEIDQVTWCNLRSKESSVRDVWTELGIPSNKELPTLRTRL